MKAIIHIVEDNIFKATSISDFLNGEFGETFCTSVYGSFQSALRAVEVSVPDLIVLDMTLPTFDRKPNSREGRIRPIGGYDLMHKMKHRSLMAAVIVVTQLEQFGEGEEEVSFSEITTRCEREFPDIFLGSVYYDQGGLNWQGELASLVRMFLSHKR
jgi:CheY-like chemotaxis protein